MSKRPLRIRVVGWHAATDQHHAKAQGLADALRALPGVQVLAERPAAEAPPEDANRAAPDILMFRVDGVISELVAVLQQERCNAPKAGVLAVLAPGEIDGLPALFDAGAAGFVQQETLASDLPIAAHVALSGGVYLSRPLIEALLDSLQKGRVVPDVFGLTAREREILSLIAVNMSNKDIARKLDLSVRTVETHRLNIRKKTSAGNWRELSAIASRLGLLGNYPLPPGLAERHAAPGFHEK